MLRLGRIQRGAYLPAGWRRSEKQPVPPPVSQSVLKLMGRYPKISRALAEQEIHLYLTNPNGYMAAQTRDRKRKGPSEDELEPPVDLADKALVVAWVGILTLAVVTYWKLFVSTL
mmetsp:Transcript_9469/g.21372  ORF Transcript_9469/g.21372 Transcript_9469/m.21372 type:complete len:115 (-) Transcript_9469:240-584(-)